MSTAIVTGSPATATGLSGMRAAQRHLDVSAHNIANAQTPGFQRQTAVQTAQSRLGGVSAEVQQAPTAQPNEAGLGRMADDVVEQGMSLYSFAANLMTVKTQDEILGSLLDTRA